MWKKIKNRFYINLLTKTYYQNKSGVIESLEHRKLQFKNYQYHRIYAQGCGGNAFGVGVSADFYEAQLMAMSECVERSCFLESGLKTTNGTSCHFDRNLAHQKSILEIVERDQLLLKIYFSDHLNKISNHGLCDAADFYHMTFDLPVHVVMSAINFDGNRVAYGFGCDFSLEIAMFKAFKESLVVYDSRDVEINKQQVSNKLFHLIPFLYPKCDVDLPKFEVNNYQIMPVDFKVMARTTFVDLCEDLNAKKINFSYSHKVVPLVFGRKIYFGVAQSNHLQDLFFSKDQILLNPNRLAICNLPSEPRHKVLHPIS